MDLGIDITAKRFHWSETKDPGLPNSDPCIPLSIVKCFFRNSQFLLTSATCPFSCHSDKIGAHSTQYPAECGFIRNPQPNSRTTQNTVVPNCHNRANRTGAANNADHRQNDHVHRVIKTRGATPMIYGLLCL